jgi:hypothetical protein
VTSRLGGGHPIADQCESGAQLLLIELWSAGVPPRRAGGSHAVAGSLGDQARFELHDGAIPWSHIGITGDYLWKEIDHPLERFRSLRANHFNSKGFVFP